MAQWQPASENPQPEPWFTKELNRIDPELRAVWALQRYLRNEWAIERRTPPERYFLMYESILSSDRPRFIEQPIYDRDQPVLDPFGQSTGVYKQVGTRLYDLAPEYECVAFRSELNNDLLTLIKKLYWERDHPEAVYEELVKESVAKAHQEDSELEVGIHEGIKDAFLETRKVVQFGHGQHRSENK